VLVKIYWLVPFNTIDEVHPSFWYDGEPIILAFVLPKMSVTVVPLPEYDIESFMFKSTILLYGTIVGVGVGVGVSVGVGVGVLVSVGVGVWVSVGVGVGVVGQVPQSVLYVATLVPSILTVL